MMRVYYKPKGGLGSSPAPRERIVIISDRIFLGPEEERVYVHEFTHLLQYQYFGVPPGSECLPTDLHDRCMTRTALYEGDAELVMEMYGDTSSSGGAMNRVELGWPGGWSKEGEAGLEQMPDCLLARLHFPYTYGRAFVRALYEEGGWDAVNAAYADPPRSTEHVLHPYWYLADEIPQQVSVPSLSHVLGPGWRSADDGVLGEYGMRCYLAQQVSREEATAAAEGWGGDRYRVYYREGGEILLALRIVWDTPADAEEFVDTYTAYAGTRFGHGANVVDVGRTCWRGEDYLCLAWEGVETTVVLGPDVVGVRAVFGALEGAD